jgi:hypothetical protein
VEFVLGDFVDDLEIKDGHITTRANKSIPADLVVRFLAPRLIQVLSDDIYLGFRTRTSSEHQVRRVSRDRYFDTFWLHKS